MVLSHSDILDFISDRFETWVSGDCDLPLGRFGQRFVGCNFCFPLRRVPLHLRRVSGLTFGWLCMGRGGSGYVLLVPCTGSAWHGVSL